MPSKRTTGFEEVLFVTLFGILFTVAMLLLTVPFSIWNGFVLTKLWAWFVVPVFGLPTLSLPLAIGIGIVAAYLTYQYVDTGQKYKWEAILSLGILRPAFALFFGYVVHLFV